MGCFNKFVLFVLNFIVFVVGVGVVALASIVIHRGSEYGQLLFQGVLTLPVWTLVVGLIISIIGFFGCCGAAKENRCMLYTYASIVGILLLAEIVLGILVLVFPQQAKEHIKDGMMKAFNKYGTGDSALDTAIDSSQHDLECCGVTHYDDWNAILHNNTVPLSCCKDPSVSSCNIISSSSFDVYNEGCFEAIVDEFKDVTLALGITAIVLAIVQLACIAIACGLAGRRSEYV